MGSALVHECLLFLLAAGIAILVLVTAHETILTWYSSFGPSPIGALVRCSGCFFGDAILLCFFVRLSRVAQALSAWSWVFHVLSRMSFTYVFYIPCIGFMQ